MKFRKKPVVIEARQIGLTWEENKPIMEWCNGRIEDQDGMDSDNYLAIDTLEGTMRADVGDWIIKGVKGEFYPCKPDIFAATHTQVSKVDQGSVLDSRIANDGAIELGRQMAGVAVTTLQQQLREAEERAVQAKQKRDLFRNQLTVQEQRTGTWHRACDEAEALITQLEPYVQHKGDCNSKYHGAQGPLSCSCGLAALVRARPQEAEEEICHTCGGLVDCAGGQMACTCKK